LKGSKNKHRGPPNILSPTNSKKECDEGQKSSKILKKFSNPKKFSKIHRKEHFFPHYVINSNATEAKRAANVLSGVGVREDI
jgi:hypothetical protein